MKMQEAMKIMAGIPNRAGFLVHFEHAGGGFLRSDYFPDVRVGEEPIKTEDEAWEMAEQFAARTRRRMVNIYVVHAEDFTPVDRYAARKIANR